MSMTTELIKRIKNFAHDYATIDTDTMEILNEAAQTIEELSAKLHTSQMERSSKYYNNGWIPVNEVEHPQKEGFYWVHEQNYGGKEDAPFHEHVEHTLFWNGSVWLNSGRYYDDRCSYITAWRPLPEPYREE